MTRDSELQKRIEALRTRLSTIEANMRELPTFSEQRRAYLADRERASRQLAMLTEDERRPTFAKPAEFGRADDYTEWRKAQGL